MIRTLLVNLILICCFAYTHAQQISIEQGSPSISVNGAPFVPTDTIRTNDSIVFEVVYSNPGTVNINSPIDLVIQKSGDSTRTDTLFDTAPVDTILAGGMDTLIRRYATQVDQSNSIYTPNGGGAIVFVVWPSVRDQPNTPVTDSSSITLYREYLASIELGDNSQFKIFPNPSKNSINIDWGAYENKVGRVRIVNSLGQVLFEKNEGPNRIQTSKLKPGHYWIQAELKDGLFIVRPFIKE